MKGVICAACAVLFALVCLFSVRADEINLTGNVSDASTQEPIIGAAVSLAGQDVSTVTDENGDYVLSGTSGVLAGFFDSRIIKAPIYRENSLFFGVENSGEQVRIDLYTLSGRRAASVMNGKLDKGNYRISPFSRNLAKQVYFVNITVGKNTSTLKAPLLERPRQASAGALQRIGGCSFEAGAAKAAQVNDTIVVSAPGYTGDRMAITSYTGINDFELVYAGFKGSVMVNYSYYQSFLEPMRITVIDSDLTEETVTVTVKSETDPVGFSVTLDSLSGMFGWYEGTVDFGYLASDSQAGVLGVADDDSVMAFYYDASSDSTIMAFGKWNGSAGSVQPGQSIYMGVLALMDLSLTDPDIQDSTAVISIRSEKDTNGINITLEADEYSAGTFVGVVGFTLGESIDDSLIAVFGDGDNLIIRYDDAAPEGLRMGTVMFLPFEGTVTLDSLFYHGTGSTMGITLKDLDVTDASVVVNIISKRDPAGISYTLDAVPDDAGTFSGSIGFSAAASEAGIIAVNESDTVTVTYTDDMPEGTEVIKEAYWLSE